MTWEVRLVEALGLGGPHEREEDSGRDRSEGVHCENEEIWARVGAVGSFSWYRRNRPTNGVVDFGSGV